MTAQANLETLISSSCLLVLPWCPRQSLLFRGSLPRATAALARGISYLNCSALFYFVGCHGSGWQPLPGSRKSKVSRLCFWSMTAPPIKRHLASALARLLDDPGPSPLPVPAVEPLFNERQGPTTRAIECCLPCVPRPYLPHHAPVCGVATDGGLPLSPSPRARARAIAWAAMQAAAPSALPCVLAPPQPCALGAPLAAGAAGHGRDHAAAVPSLLSPFAHPPRRPWV